MSHPTFRTKIAYNMSHPTCKIENGDTFTMYVPPSFSFMLLFTIGTHRPTITCTHMNLYMHALIIKGNVKTCRKSMLSFQKIIMKFNNYG